MHVLVPIDDSDPADAALEYAVTEFPDADITALHVIDPYETSLSSWLGGDEFSERLEEDAAELLAAATERAAEHDTSIDTERVVGKPSTEIPKYVEELDVDRVVIGSHGRRGSARVLLGSVAEQVVRRVPVSVTVVR
ncbi:universal stress protein [Salinadaptatus halalkaliphilus]|uniref:Universal stress protein n=1 Tax=Salinadaptatus halalkaliphilus TaxID=2419781 RepID=A0A4S3TJ09_9EURY|nr:universal stress protein [Salinadaptatus halalkaliphilus]THE63952.1 universal stress protein [Salinadaptatus halalkaliphilus]